jgi:hypothetical protein
MPDRIRLYPECHADTALITFLFKDKQLIEHAAGINEVSKSLETVKSDAVTLLGIIDNDKHKPRYLRHFELIEEINKLCFCHKPESNQYLIIIDKAVETFLLWNALQVNVILSDYGFPVAVKPLGARLKRQNIESDIDYLRLLTDLRDRHAPGFITLQRILHELTP